MMTDKEVYKKTLPFSLRRMSWDTLGILLLAALTVAGFFIGGAVSAEGDNSAPVVGLIIGAIIGLIVFVFITRWNSYKNKAAQIAMMTRGVTEDSLPEDVVGEGKAIVKERFATVAGYYALTSLIKGAFNELGRIITNVGRSVGGDTGETVGSAISSVIQVVVRYLCDCCLGWVFYRSTVSAPKASCEGAVIFFKHGKTLLKNLGRIFGIGIALFLLIGGVFAVIIYFILDAIKLDQGFLNSLAQNFAEAETQNFLTEFLSKPENVVIAIAILGGIILWDVVHTVFIRPYVLVGVLRNYIASGADDVPTEESFATLDSKSAKFRKLHAQAT